DIQAISAGKQPEGTPDAWIHIQDFVLAVAMITTEAYVQNPAVADSAHEIRRSLDHAFVGDTNSQAGHAGFRRKSADLASGHAEKTAGLGIEIAVEHPVVSGNELLEDQVGLCGIARLGVKIDQFARRLDEELGPAGPGAKTAAAGLLYHHGKSGA